MALVLIVDDSPTEVHVMQKALEQHGFSTIAASDGSEANDPVTRKIPVIMVTSKGQESDRVWGLRQGAVDYIVKPVSTDRLVQKAQAAITG